MKLKHLLLVAAILLGERLHAAPPPLSLPAKVTGKPGAFIGVNAVTPGKTVRWLVLDPGLNLFPTDLLKDTHTAVVTASTPGTYRLLAVTAVADEVSAPAIAEVVIEGASPTPPTPNPPPNPAPVGKAAWAILLIDNNARTPAIGQILSSTTLSPALQARGVTLRVLDVTDPLVKAKEYQQFLDAAGGPPVLLALTSDGKKVSCVKLPGDEAGILTLFPAPANSAPACGPNGCPFCPAGGFIYPEFKR